MLPTRCWKYVANQRLSVSLKIFCAMKHNMFVYVPHSCISSFMDWQPSHQSRVEFCTFVVFKSLSHPCPCCEVLFYFNAVLRFF